MDLLPVKYTRAVKRRKHVEVPVPERSYLGIISSRKPGTIFMKENCVLETMSGTRYNNEDNINSQLDGEMDEWILY